MGGKGENNMAPCGRDLIETKDQKMFIMSLVPKKKESENVISIVPQANRMKGEKISWLLRGGGTITPLAHAKKGREQHGSPWPTFN